MLTTILEQIEAHGLAVVLLVVILLWLKPKINQLWDMQINGSKYRDDDFRNHFTASMEKTIRIQNLLNSLLVNTKADRAYIFEFHNGGHTVAGVDFTKCTNTYEVVNSGILPQIKNLQNLPIAMFILFVKMVISNKAIKIADIEEFKELGDNGSYESLKAQGIGGIYAVGIYDDQQRPIGFIGLDYCKTCTFITATGIKRAKNLSAKLSVLLTEDAYEYKYSNEKEIK